MLRKRRTELPTGPVDYPSGSCVKTEKGLFLIKGTKRYRIVSERVLASWSFPRVIVTSEAAVAKYKILGKLGFRESSLLYNIKDGKMYLVSENKRRHITSPDVLDRLGATSKDVMTVSDDEIKLHEEGTEVK